MKTTKANIVLFLVILMLVPLMGCAGVQSHGKLRFQAGDRERVTIEQLVERWQSFDVYYSGIAVHKPSAILFDPKGDERTLQVHPWWVRVDSKDTLLEIFEWINFYRKYPPRLRVVLGPNDDFFGYIYSAWDHALIRVVDDKTLWVNELSMPRDESPGEGGVGSLR